MQTSGAATLGGNLTLTDVILRRTAATVVGIGTGTNDEVRIGYVGSNDNWGGNSEVIYFSDAASGNLRGSINSIDSGTYASMLNIDAGAAYQGVLSESTNQVAKWKNGNFDVISNTKLGLDAVAIGSGGGVADTYFIKTTATGGNLSTYYDATELLRVASTTNYAIVPNAVVGAAITGVASSTLHVVGTFQVTALPPSPAAQL